MITLSAGAARCHIDPNRGAILHWRIGDVDLLRPCINHDDPKSFACFVMAPWVNRIAHGAFSFAGRDVTLPLDRVIDAHALHGQAWLQPWRLSQNSATECALEFDGGGDDWPWPYHLQQTIALQEDAVFINLKMHNRADQTAPAAIGLHPTFLVDAATTLQFHAIDFHPMRGEHLCVTAQSIPEQCDFSNPRVMVGAGIDDCYGGWRGFAQLGRIELRAQGCDFLHVYSPAGRNEVALEPQTAPPNAPHHQGGCAFRALGPGEQLSISMLLKNVGGHGGKPATP
jgi:aldose 1-epimerase